MYGHCIGKFQFFQLFKGVLRLTSILKFHCSGLRKFIDLRHDTCIAVKYPDSFIYRNLISSEDFPLQLIIVFHLHHLISLTEKALPDFFFFFLLIWRIQIALKDLIQSFHAKKPLTHGSQNLDFIRLRINITWKFLLDQRDHNPNDNICIVSLQEKEIPAFIVDRNLFSAVDLMCIYYNITLGSLPEDLLQLHY